MDTHTGEARTHAPTHKYARELTPVNSRVRSGEEEKGDDKVSVDFEGLCPVHGSCCCEIMRRPARQTSHNKLSCERSMCESGLEWQDQQQHNVADTSLLGRQTMQCLSSLYLFICFSSLRLHESKPQLCTCVKFRTMSCGIIWSCPDSSHLSSSLYISIVLRIGRSCLIFSSVPQ